MAQSQIQEQKQEQKLGQNFSQQQLLQAQLVELPITQLLERVNTEMNDNPALEVGTDPQDYPNLVNELKDHGGTLGFDTRFKLMKKAFAHTAEYDTAIAAFFTARTWEEVHNTYTYQA